jgi:hypothetical protein
LQNAKAPATEAAAKAAEAAAKAAEASAQLIPKNTTDFTIQNQKIYDVASQVLFTGVYEQMRQSLNAGADLPSAVLGANYQARAEQEYAAFLSQITMSGIAGQSLTSGMAQGLPLSNALSGSRYAAQGAASYGAGATINVNTGVGDPEAIARAVEDVIRQANQRGTTSLSIG